jgi:hypothetical protein
VTHLRDSMVDVQSPQQALRSYSSAKEYAWGILCDARDEDSNTEPLPWHTPGERGTLACPESPNGQHRDCQTPYTLAPNGEYPSPGSTPPCDESHLGNNPVSRLGHLEGSRGFPRERDIPTIQTYPLRPATNMYEGSATDLPPLSPQRLTPSATATSQVNPVPPRTCRKSRSSRMAAWLARPLCRRDVTRVFCDHHGVHHTSS